MNKKQTDILSDYVLHTALHMLTLEDQCLKHICAEDLSVRELHVIEAVAALSASEKNTMAEIAKYLRISPASLTSAVSVLVKKGYIKRDYSPLDRRVIYVILTQNGEEANRRYLTFVRNLMDYIGRDLDEEVADKMIDALMKIVDYFERAADGDVSFE